MAYKLYETDHEARLNFVNWHFHGVHNGQVNPKRILFSSENLFEISGYMNS